MAFAAFSHNGSSRIKFRRTRAIALASLVALTCVVGNCYTNCKMDRDELQAFVKKQLSSSSAITIRQNLAQGNQGDYEQVARSVVVDNPVLISSLASTLSIGAIENISNVPMALLPEATIEIENSGVVVWISFIAYSEDLRGGSPVRAVIVLPTSLNLLGIGDPRYYLCEFTSDSSDRFSDVLTKCLDSK